MNAPPLIVIAGPTGVGKSALAMELAARCDGEIISADSIQVYRGMDIGSAKPSLGERAKIPHHCIDLVEAGQPFSVEQFVGHATAAAAAIAGRGKRIFAVGGSGFYLRAFFGPVTGAHPIGPSERQFVAELARREGLSGLLRELDRRNGRWTAAIDRNNGRRVARALELSLASGLGLDELRKNFHSLRGPFADFAVRTVLLDRTGPDYMDSLRGRIDQMLSAGLVEETLALRRSGFEANPSAGRAVGYREVLDFLDGKFPEDELADRIFIRTRQLVRKQRTWFRHQLPADQPLWRWENGQLSPEDFANLLAFVRGECGCGHRGAGG
jgi:tRNA dimethylallyltransferase